MGNKRRFESPQPNRGNRILADGTTDVDPFRLPPKFCLRHMRNGYSLMDCEKREKAAFADRLYELSRQSWAELHNAPRHGQGYEQIKRNAIKGDEVPSHITPDVQLIAFRCIGKASMVGYRSRDGVFNILWIDRACSLYDH